MVSHYSGRNRSSNHRNPVVQPLDAFVTKNLHAARNDCRISSQTHSHPAILCRHYKHTRMVTFIYLQSAGIEQWLIVCWGNLVHRGRHSFQRPTGTTLSSDCTGITEHEKPETVAGGIYAHVKMQILGVFLGAIYRGARQNIYNNSSLHYILKRS